MVNEPLQHPSLSTKREQVLQVSLLVTEIGDGDSVDFKSTLFMFLHERWKWQWLQTADGYSLLSRQH